MKVRVFTDGACTHNGKKDAKAAYAYYFPDSQEHSGAARVPEDQTQTNNRGELLGISEAVIKAASVFDPSDVQLTIYTDSDYSKNCITKWLPGWVSKGWKTAAGEPVKNRDLIEKISSDLLQFESYSIVWVRAHTGGDDELSKHNHTVDRMATEVLEGKKEEEVKKVTIEGIGGCPLQMMGPPVSEASLVSWCKKNLDKLDETALTTALIQALSKTYKKNGQEVVKQKMHRSTLYRLVSSSHIITETTKND